MAACEGKICQNIRTGSRDLPIATRRRNSACHASEQGVDFAYPSLLFRNSPMLVEKTGGDDFAWPARTGRSVEIDDGVVRKLGRLFGVRTVSVSAKINAAID